MKRRIVLSIIIVSTNETSELLSCIASIFHFSPRVHYEIIVIDNASKAPVYNTLKRVYPRIRIIRREKRGGFASNNNIGIKKAKGSLCLLLNPDTEITKNALNTIVKYMITHKSVGVCGPKLVFPNGKLQYSCRKFPTWRSVLARRTPLRTMLKNSKFNRDHLLIEKNHEDTQSVDWLLGACLCIRKNILDNVGLLDERYFLYVDDIDYCLRVHKAGWGVYYLPTAVVIHHHRAHSDKSLFNVFSFYHFLSMIRFAWKYKDFLIKF